jgi:hypothetical protein
MLTSSTTIWILAWRCGGELERGTPACGSAHLNQDLRAFASASLVSAWSSLPSAASSTSRAAAISSLLSSSTAASAAAGTRNWTVSLHQRQSFGFFRPAVRGGGIESFDRSSGFFHAEIAAVKPAPQAPLRQFLQLALLSAFKAGSVREHSDGEESPLIAQPHPFANQSENTCHPFPRQRDSTEAG